MNNKEIGVRILDARKKQGYTQRQLGDLINVSDKAVSRWERGVGCPDISLLLPLSDALHISIDELISGNTSDKNETKTIQNIINYTKAKTIENKVKIIKIVYAFISISLLLAIIISCFCDYFLNNDFTWSTISTTAIVYAFIILTTFVYSKKYKIAKTSLVASISVIPLLFVIANQLYDLNWFYHQALITSIMSNVYIILVTVIWYKTKWNLWYKFASFVFLTLIVNCPINYISELNIIAQITNILINILIGIILIFIGYRKNNKNKR